MASRKQGLHEIAERERARCRQWLRKFVRDGQPDFSAHPPRFLQHLGIYAYRRRFLLTLADLPPHPLELLEKLEQLRVLAHGRCIQVGVVGQSTPGVDTYDDYQQFVATWRQNRQGRAA